MTKIGLLAKRNLWMIRIKKKNKYSIRFMIKAIQIAIIRDTQNKYATMMAAIQL